MKLIIDEFHLLKKSSKKTGPEKEIIEGSSFNGFYSAKYTVRESFPTSLGNFCFPSVD